MNRNDPHAALAALPMQDRLTALVYSFMNGDPEAFTAVGDLIGVVAIMAANLPESERKAVAAYIMEIGLELIETRH